MSTLLETGKFYRANGYTYLIGKKVPCIANKYCIRITKTGRARYGTLYYIQDNNFKESKRKVLLHRRYKKLYWKSSARDIMEIFLKSLL